MRAADARPAAAVPGRVLLVDDDHAVARGIARILRRLHEVVIVDSALAALSLLQSDDRFDVILTDLIMPDFTGIDLHDWVRDAKPELAERLAFMTGGIFDRDVQAFMDGCGRPCFDKPMEPHILREAVAELVVAARREPQGRAS